VSRRWRVTLSPTEQVNDPQKIFKPSEDHLFQLGKGGQRRLRLRTIPLHIVRIKEVKEVGVHNRAYLHEDTSMTSLRGDSKHTSKPLSLAAYEDSDGDDDSDQGSFHEPTSHFSTLLSTWVSNADSELQTPDLVDVATNRRRISESAGKLARNIRGSIKSIPKRLTNARVISEALPSTESSLAEQQQQTTTTKTAKMMKRYSESAIKATTTAVTSGINTLTKSPTKVLSNVSAAPRGKESRWALTRKVSQPKLCKKLLVMHSNEEADDDYELPKYQHSKEDVARIVKSLKKNFAFADKTDEELEKFATVFEKCHYKKDDVFFFQGEKGDYFYLLRSGEVRFVVDGVTVNKTSKKGATFGELSLFYSCPRSASAVAETDCRLLRIGQVAFRKKMKKQTETLEQQKIELLSKVPFLQSLSETNLKRLASVLFLSLFEKNQVLLAKGQIADKLYIVKTGQVQYQGQTIRAGEYFLEKALAEDVKLVEDIVALTKGMVYTLDRKTIQSIFGNVSSLLRKSQDAGLLNTMSFFQQASLKREALITLASLVTDKTFSTGEMIVQAASKTTPAMYLVRKGAVKVTSTRPNQEAQMVHAGGYFGEELLRTSRAKSDLMVNATITAEVMEEPCVCGMLTLSDCRTVFDTDLFAAPTTEASTSNEEEMEAIRSIQYVKTKSMFAFLPEMKMPTSLQGVVRHKILGEGIFGQVWLAASKADDSVSPVTFALKIQSKYDLFMEGQAKAVMQEKEIMSELSHPFIIEQYTTYQDADFLYTALSFIRGGELFSLMHNNDEGDSIALPEDHARFYALAIADALAYMHSQSISFRDMKPENVMIDEMGYPVIIEFGFAKKVPDKTYTFCGTPG